jgi:hypothetical protein
MFALVLSEKIREQELKRIDLMRLTPLLGFDRLELKFPAAGQFCARNDRCQPGQKGDEYENEARGVELSFVGK